MKFVVVWMVLVAQSSDLLDQAKKATAIYADRREAIAAGYRKVGRDLPSMGEHWLSPKRLVDGKFDVSDPQVLTYVMIDGRPVLTGVVYAIPLTGHEKAPDTFGAEAVWHEHNGPIDEEALLPLHHTAPSHIHEGTRVAFLHAWIHAPHSDGVFGAENWAIPFFRLGLPVPEKFTNATARALSLMNVGRTYFRDLLNNPATEKSLDDAAAAVSAIATGAQRDHRALTDAELRRLDAVWTELLGKVQMVAGHEGVVQINGGESH